MLQSRAEQRLRRGVCGGYIGGKTSCTAYSLSASVAFWLHAMTASIWGRTAVHAMPHALMRASSGGAGTFHRIAIAAAIVATMLLTRLAGRWDCSSTEEAGAADALRLRHTGIHGADGISACVVRAAGRPPAGSG